MGALDSRVTIITGAGRGIGRQHALFFAQQGAKLVLNDNGTEVDGTGADPSCVEQTAQLVRELGGEAITNADSIAEWDTGRKLVEMAVSQYGELHCVVNNAGILRFAALPDMTELDWDLLMDTHTKGTVSTTRHAAAYWRDQFNAGKSVKASVVNTTSSVGLQPPAMSLHDRDDEHAAVLRQIHFEMMNYSVAKSAVAAFSQRAGVALAPFGIRVNAVGPEATYTRMAGDIGQSKATEDPAEFHHNHPANIAPVVGWLSQADCPVNAMVFSRVSDVLVEVMAPWYLLATVDRAGEAPGRWTIDELPKAMAQVPSSPPEGWEASWEARTDGTVGS